MSPQQQAPFAATCPDCEVTSDATEANEIVDFYRRHHRHTGHDVVVARADIAFDVPATDDVLAIVDALDARYEDGVPVGIVVAAASEQGVTVGETLDAIREVRLTGALAEPRDDHLTAV
ncbi:hypothetical protein [Halosolutus halophilus]|uniref:hypothetical protein n=1 Tax=Halosolutus halophilus TaxID=1552990 RepID=UPI0022350394|nr:hypothetical protein [Halosolutus halophilus]